MKEPKIQMTTSGVLHEVYEERARQQTKWGTQNHPDGTSVFNAPLAEQAKRNCELGEKLGKTNWTDILSEECMEAFSEIDPELLRKELIQVAAVAVAWIEDIDRRTKGVRVPQYGETADEA